MIVKAFNRNELRGLKKDILEQIKAEIELDSLHIPHCNTYGDNVYEGVTRDVRFCGRVTKKESNNLKVEKMGKLTIEIIEVDNEYDVLFSVECTLVDEYDWEVEEWVTLNI